MATEGSPKNLIVLVIGKGGREHALAWQLSQAASVRHVFVFPGNAGTQEGVVNISNLTCAITDHCELAQCAKELEVGLVVVGPDDLVVEGIEKVFRDVGIPCFSPSREAAVLEGSKVFAKSFMERNSIPTAKHRSFDEMEDAISYLQKVDHRIVIKADGLAAGKGVGLPDTKAEALDELHSIMRDGKFAEAGSSVVIEEYMEGDEISILTFSDGETFYSLPPGQDHKRVLDGNKGPNTGGMGVYSPVPFVSQETLRQIDSLILEPTFAALKALLQRVIVHRSDDHPDWPEGDRIQHLAQILLSCTNGTLAQHTLKLRPGFACNVVVASGGYPGQYTTDKAIVLRSPGKDVVVFHAGTRKDETDGTLRTAGGRVFSVAAYGETLAEAVRKAYEGVDCVDFESKLFRKDIASRCLNE
ncbi:hypothetical protein G7046_g7908 [Stylonectria norvegica]|nr:hypothetical protein G7046_g7908 [Stylonectria norvegica]